MEELNLFETFGFYEPGFLHLRLNTGEDLTNLNELKKSQDNLKYYSSFFHEYIHFLQDVTTTFGLADAAFMIDFIKFGNQKIKKDNTVPIVITNEFNTQTNRDSQKAIYGDRKVFNRILYQSYTPLIEKIKDKDNITIELTKYKILFFDYDTRSYKSCIFGVSCIKEYITHSLQNILFPDTIHPDIPYLIAELIVKKELPDFGKDPLLITALCDASLMSRTPNQTFFKAIEKFKEKSLPKSIDEVYDSVYACISNSSLSIEANYTCILEVTKRQYQNAFSEKSELFKNNNTWLTTVFNNASKIRLNDRSFICKLIQEPGKISDSFFKIFNLLGTPFMTNNKMQGWFYPPLELGQLDVSSYFPLILKSIIKVYYGGCECDLIKFCKKSKVTGTGKTINITNHNCKSSPWLRVNDTPSCPFGILWETWGLRDTTPVNRKHKAD